MPKIESKKTSHHSQRFAEIENPDLAPRPKHPKKLRQPRRIIRQIPKPKRSRDQIQRTIRKRQMQRIGLDHRGSSPGQFRPSPHQHLRRKIRRHNRLCILRTPPQQRQGHIACAAANIQHLRLRPLQNRPESPRRPPPPRPIHIARQHMVQQIVTRRNAVEHRPHRFRRTRLVARARRPRSRIVT